MKKKGKVEAVGTRVKPDGSIEFLGNPSEEAKRQVLAELERQRRHEEERGELWGPVGPGAMVRLCAAFPSLRGVPGTDPWDADALLEWMLGPAPTSGSTAAALFVLGVWNPSTDWNEVVQEYPPRRCARCEGTGRVDRETGAPTTGESPRAERCRACDGKGQYTPSLGRHGRFDLFAAMSVWDREHIEAFKMWVAYPFFP